MNQKLPTLNNTFGAFDLDQAARHLVGMYSAARVKIGLQLAEILKNIEDNKLYLKLDSAAYPSFSEYLKSLDIKYKTAREIMGVYETYVLVAGKSIDELSEIAYHKLAILKSTLFKKQEGQYQLAVPIKEVDKWLSDTSLSQQDLSQKIKEEKVGPHEHEFIVTQTCIHCGLKEIIHGTRKTTRAV